MPGGYFDQEDPNWGNIESGGEGSIAVNADKQLEVKIEKNGSMAMQYKSTVMVLAA